MRRLPGFVTLLIGVACLTLAPSVTSAEDPEEAAREGPSDAERSTSLIEALRSEDGGVRLQAAEEASEIQDDKLVGALIRALKDKEPEVRSALVRALGSREGKTPRRRAALALAPRLKRLAKHPADREELLETIAALHDLAQPSTIKALLDGIDEKTDKDEGRARLFAIGNVPVADAIERLIQFLDTGRRGRRHHARAADEALQYATGVRTGGGPEAWRAWWRKNEKSFDFEVAAAERRAAEAAAAAKKAEAEKKRREKAEAKERRKREREERKKRNPPPERED